MPSNNALQDVNPTNALVWYEGGPQFDLAGGSNLLTDGDMEAASTAEWVNHGNGVASKQTANPRSGTRCLRVSMPDTGYAKQSKLVVGRSYRVSGYARGDGGVPPKLYIGSGFNAWNGTASTSWQSFNVEGVCATDTYLYLGSAGNGYVEFDDVAVYQLSRVTANLATAPGAPKLLTMGDGTTSTTFPTQLVGRHGVSLDGGDYINTGIVDPFERTDKFSLFVTANITSHTLIGYISSDDAAQSYRGMTVTYSGNQDLYTYTNSSVAANNWVSAQCGANRGLIRQFHSVCLTSNGGSNLAGFSVYTNAMPRALTATVDNLTGTIKSGKPFLIGARHNGAAKANYFIGNIYFAAIFPWELSPQQVQYLDRYCKTRINAA